MVLAQDSGAVDAADATTGLDALIAIGAIIGGFAIGALLAALVRRFAAKEGRPEMIQRSAGALATLVFSIVLIVALVIALGLVSPSSLDSLISDLQGFIPQFLSAAIVVILANVVAELSATGAERSLAHLPEVVRRRVPPMLKYGILGFAIIVAADQLGVDTTIITVMVAAFFFGLAAAAAMLAGLGGRAVAGQLAAGRALRQNLSIGDDVTVGSLSGTIEAIGSTSTQITTSDRVFLVPNEELLESTIAVTPSEPSDPDDD